MVGPGAHPIRDAHVAVTGAGATRTDRRGRFTIPNLSARRAGYQIIVAARGTERAVSIDRETALAGPVTVLINPTDSSP